MTSNKEKKGIYERQPFALFAYHSIKPEIDHTVFHFHNNYEILLYLKGDMELYIEQSRYVPVPGTLFVINTEEVHKGTLLGTGTYERYVLHFSASLIQPLLGYDVDLLSCFNNREPGIQNAVVLTEEEVKEFCRIFRDVCRVMETEPYGKEVLKITYVAQIMTLVNCAFSHAMMPPSRPISSLTASIMYYVETHLNQQLSLESIASALFMDKYYMSHQFKKQTGDSLYHFILMKRIALARRLLGEGRSVMEVCEQTGFNNYNNFIRTFRKYVKIPPGEYRKHQKD
ncbi:AraC family transcriptional regulator [Lachnospiraceae bacterium 54-53]